MMISSYKVAYKLGFSLALDIDVELRFELKKWQFRRSAKDIVEKQFRAGFASGRYAVNAVIKERLKITEQWVRG